MNDCPCCSAKLLCHISQKKIYWFCPNCGQEMPNINYLHSAKQAHYNGNRFPVWEPHQPTTVQKLP